MLQNETEGKSSGESNGLSEEKQEYTDYTMNGVHRWHCDRTVMEIEMWLKRDRKEDFLVLWAIAADVERGGQVLVPFRDPEPSRPHEPAQEILIPQMNGLCWISAFTDENEAILNRGERLKREPLKDLLERALNGKGRYGGIVLNRWDAGFVLTRGAIRDILRQNARTQDERDLDAGAEAYNAGDYETALCFYRKAAEAGNVTALSNLGYCYWYGRGVPVDRQKAKQCWERAALLGDICSLYKLADVIREEDPAFARVLYLRAFYLAGLQRDRNVYPDTCLRVLKYCLDSLPAEEVPIITRDAVMLFEERVENGDPFAESLLQQARELQMRLG